MNYIINFVAMYVYNYYQTIFFIIIKIFYEIINYHLIFMVYSVTLN